jgi:hypothetical protein
MSGTRAPDSPPLRVLHLIPSPGWWRCGTASVPADAGTGLAWLRGAPWIRGRRDAPGPNSSRPAVTLHRIPARGNHDPRLALRLIRLVRTLRPQLVQTWLPQMDVLGGLAARIAGTPWILCEREQGRRAEAGAVEEATSARTRPWCIRDRGQFSCGSRVLACRRTGNDLGSQRRSAGADRARGFDRDGLRRCADAPVRGEVGPGEERGAPCRSAGPHRSHEERGGVAGGRRDRSRRACAHAWRPWACPSAFGSPASGTMSGAT